MAVGESRLKGVLMPGQSMRGSADKYNDNGLNGEIYSLLSGSHLKIDDAIILDS